ncbi:conserved hypothetical protein [Talaromyces stipitatus ATCC 10500]|uniref:Uncharacterized protein n=1 Tax=Talaromyces stipitatus (strain ATCC 10500 / CBS 375.48 / QM 6759 / NRRL 1006) TaxID=441959 RepID=B8MV56_TALSN|nr:uncharacterized protein TSTA_008100 [Talaromyces stipitatus ATCC 10500]EED11512.1 conserved hypothetical protein [Talaromyces stipitatus ATCC 10500]
MMEFHNLMFERLTEFPVIVCRECRYAVWANQIEGHLKQAHRHILMSVRKQLAKEICSWPDIAIEPIELDISPTRTHAILQLIGPLRRHWREQHDWCRSSKYGHPTKKEQIAIRQKQERVCQPVKCQRLFPRKMGSQYFAIIDNHDSTDEADSPSLSNAATFWEQANAKFAEFEKKLAEKIAQGHVDEANPWLRRTGWLLYLKPFTFHKLQALIEAPEPPSEDENQSAAIPDTETAEKRTAWAVWSAMGEVGRLSQLSVLHMGVFVRMEAIRSERNQTRYQPLEAYQDANAVTDRVRPWQQILMFFWRTQQQSESQERQSQYRFTRRQKEAWKRLVQIAQS